MSRTPQLIIDIANASCIYASNELSGGVRHGGLVDESLPSLTYLIRQGYEWLYEWDSSNTDLEPIGNYLIAICKYADKAEQLIISGGSVTPIYPPSGFPIPIDWVVSGTASSIAVLATDQTTVTLDGTGGMPDLRGYNVDFTRGGIEQYETDPGDGSTYFSWVRATGVFTLLGTNPEAVLGEQMRISPKS